ncbi:MAG: DAK2 domain-containing protein [Lactobacillaceae bacterium]|jgi:DAK2 domain fusion protein YloV|nr:DAK2 domain-containing protein [Lactobacillaceae bacterium]
METITNIEFVKMVNAAVSILTKNTEHINKLNVFPVPDGDTGTNMSMSMQTGAEYVANLNSTSVSELATAASKGLLMGARGNSGVILSQIFRGFSKSIEGLKELNAIQYAKALNDAKDMAYKAVMKPTEGTILTVIRLSAEAAYKVAENTNDIEEVAKVTFEEAKKALALTPDLLPVLKEVGVVDSGGQGLVYVFQAFYEVLSGKIADEDIQIDTVNDANFDQTSREFDAQVSINPEDIQFGYCTTILLETGKGTTFNKKWDYDKFYDRLSKLGDSLLVLQDENMVKAHVHVEDPGKVLSIATEYGSIASVKIDNMRDQQQAVIDRVNREKAELQKNIPETAVIAVAGGDGLVELFTSMGATDVIAGGQTMNPSTQDILTAIENSKAKQAIILPNNSNIFMSASQAADMAEIPVEVIKTRTIQQGLSSLLGLNPESKLDENVKSMTDSASLVKSIELTQAIRDTNLDGREIKNNDYIAIADGSIISNGNKAKDVIYNALEKTISDEDAIVTIIYGAGVKEKTANQLASHLEKKYPDIETEVHYGGQSLYPLLISIE